MSLAAAGEVTVAPNVARLASWLAEAGIAEGEIRDVRLLAGGTQNLILRLSMGGRDLVVRRPPIGRALGEKTIGREAIVLGALAGSAVPHPRFGGLCEDRAVLGAPFLVTDEVKGFNATVEMSGSAGRDPAFRHTMGLALVDGLAALASVGIESGALSALGRADGFLERQVDRWAKQLASYELLASWPGAEQLGPVAAIGLWLKANLPDDFQPGLMHGDYHIGNVLYCPEDGGLAAILDWEMAALGDPLLDLARLVTAWPNARNEGLLSLKVEPWDGFPSADELVDRYATLTGRSMDALPWFEILACYKYGIILEGSYARACAGKADAETGRKLHKSATGLIARAAATIDRA